MEVRLIEPITGGEVIAHSEEAAARLESRGFRRAEPPKPKRTTRKRKKVE